MICRERLKMEHPEQADEEYAGGCAGCPHDYGYASRPEYCSILEYAEICERCWEREVEEIKEEKEKKKMTVEELVQVLDKNSRLVIRVCHTDKALYNPLKDEEKWEIFRRKEVVQFTSVGDGIIIYVAPSVGKDS